MNNQTTTNEIWKTIEKYPNYEASNMGRIRNKTTRRILNGSVNKQGYIQVHIINKEGEKKKPLLHRLVAETFIPNPENKPTVDHIIPVSKGGTNEVSNLRWATHTEQEANKDQSYRKRTGKAKKNYCVELNKVFDSGRAAAREIGCDEISIRRVLNGMYKTAKGYHFISYDKYLDMLTAELLEAAFLNEEVEKEAAPEVTICGVPIDDYLTNEVSVNA